MRKTFLGLLLLTIGSVGCGGGSGDPVPPTNPDPPPGMSLLKGSSQEVAPTKAPLK